MHSKDSAERSGALRYTEESVLARNLDRLFERRRQSSGRQMSHAAAAAAITEETGVQISSSYLWHLRTGSQTNPKMHHLRAIAKFFGVSPASLVADTDEVDDQREELNMLMRDRGVRNVAMRAYGISPQAQSLVEGLLDRRRELEGLPPVSPDRQKTTPAVK